MLVLPQTDILSFQPDGKHLWEHKVTFEDTVWCLITGKKSCIRLKRWWCGSRDGSVGLEVSHLCPEQHILGAIQLLFHCHEIPYRYSSPSWISSYIGHPMAVTLGSPWRFHFVVLSFIILFFIILSLGFLSFLISLLLYAWPGNWVHSCSPQEWWTVITSRLLPSSGQNFLIWPVLWPNKLVPSHQPQHTFCLVLICKC